MNREQFLLQLPKGWKYKTMMGMPPSVCYYTGNWGDDTFQHIGNYNEEDGYTLKSKK
jgi:hypothetical protein